MSETPTPATEPSVTNVAGDRLPEAADTIGDSDTHDMTDTAPEIDAEPSEPATDTAAAEHADTPSRRDAKLADEAARWRVTAKQTAAQLAVEQARISEMNRREAQRLAAVHLADPADMWLEGCTPDQLVGDDGLIDPLLVEEQAVKTIEAHPHWKRATPVVGAPAAAVTGDGDYRPAPAAPTWQGFIRGGNAG